MTTSTLRLPPRIARLPQLRQIVRGGLAARGSIGAGLAAKAGGAAAVPWYLTGGISLANCKAAYAAKGAASAAAAKINLPTPGTNDAIGGVDPTWDAVNGWTGDGTMYLNAGTLTSSSASMSLIFRYANWVANGDYRCGATLYMAPLWFNATTNMSYAGSTITYSAAGATSGVIAIAGQKTYFNGVLKGTHTGTISSQIFSILARGGGANKCRGSISHYAIYDIDISAYIVALSAAMAAL